MAGRRQPEQPGQTVCKKFNRRKALRTQKGARGGLRGAGLGIVLRISAFSAVMILRGAGTRQPELRQAGSADAPFEDAPPGGEWVAAKREPAGGGS